MSKENDIKTTIWLKFGLNGIKAYHGQRLNYKSFVALTFGRMSVE